MAVLYTVAAPFRHIGSYHDSFFHIIHGTANCIPILACYVSPVTPQDHFERFLAISSRHFKGPGVLLGDLNALHEAWDKNHNCQGVQLSRWAQKNHFLTHRPPTPTFKKGRGERRIDLILHRGPISPTINVHSDVLGSDHGPVTARLNLSAIASLTAVPLSIISNQRCRERAQEQ